MEVEEDKVFACIRSAWVPFFFLSVFGLMGRRCACFFLGDAENIVVCGVCRCGSYAAEHCMRYSTKTASAREKKKGGASPFLSFFFFFGWFPSEPIEKMSVCL